MRHSQQKLEKATAACRILGKWRNKSYDKLVKLQGTSQQRKKPTKPLKRGKRGSKLETWTNGSHLGSTTGLDSLKKESNFSKAEAQLPSSEKRRGLNTKDKMTKMVGERRLNVKQYGSVSRKCSSRKLSALEKKGLKHNQKELEQMKNAS